MNVGETKRKSTVSGVLYTDVVLAQAPGLGMYNRGATPNVKLFDHSWNPEL